MTKVHMDELAPALERASAGPDLELLCESAFHRATTETIDAQLALAGEIHESTRAEIRGLLDHEPSDEEVATVAIRTLVGGSFSYGVRVGLEIARGRGWSA